MAMGIIPFFYTLLAEMFSQRPRSLTILFSVAGLLLCCGLLYLSQSRTAWVTGLIGLIFCVVTKLTHKRVGAAIIIWTAIVLLLVPAVVLAMDQLGTIATMLGRDSTLTGRVDLWLSCRLISWSARGSAMALGPSGLIKARMSWRSGRPWTGIRRTRIMVGSISCSSLGWSV